MALGKVKRFSDEKGFGFIEGEDGQDVFVHYSNVLPDTGGWRSLKPGQWVEYEVEVTEKGLQATSVEVVSLPARAVS